MTSGERGPATAPPLLGQPGFSLRYVDTFGETEVPYFDDTQHINTPQGIWAGGSALWVGEYIGSRALEYASNGSPQMQIGTGGQLYALDETELNYVMDVGVDASGDVWIVDEECHIAHFDSSGAFLGELGETWHCADDNNLFAGPSSIAFDSDGNIFVSDTGNYRVQVFDSAGTYLATVGVTGEWGSDNAHLDWPRHIAIDSGDLLYVADTGNSRVQIFNVADPLAIAYVATLGVAGESGSDNSHFDWPEGVTISATLIYVADSNNARVQIYHRTTRAYVATLGGLWGSGSYSFNWPTDVALDGAGNLYVADRDNHRVQQYNMSLIYQRTFGMTGVPYITDSQHFNGPSGVAVSGDGSIYLTEERGMRLIKLGPEGVLMWAAGEPGVTGWDDSHLNWPGDVDVASSGQAYVADSSANRIQIFSNGGSYVETLGTGNWGTGDFDLKYPMGVAVDGSGKIYVADTYNHRVQIYDASLTYIATLGVTNTAGADNDHFSWPEDVDVDEAGNIYVADGGNSRVQVFNDGRVYVRTLGETGVPGNDFGHLGMPRAVAVDSEGLTLAADDWGPRVQVHDALGQYLTTVGNGWGTHTGDLRSPEGVAVDAWGDVYIADLFNQRIQRLVRGVSDWRQTNINEIRFASTKPSGALAQFGDTLYAGTGQAVSGGAQIWRRSGGTWSSVMTDGFGNADNQAIDHLVEFNGRCMPEHTTGTIHPRRRWRRSGAPPTAPPGRKWSMGFGDPDNAEAFARDL
jgi:sugar lactone lactonase YvrE